VANIQRWLSFRQMFLSPLPNIRALLIDIGAWVLEESCRQLGCGWRPNGFDEYGCAVLIFQCPIFRDPLFINVVKDGLSLVEVLKPEKIDHWKLLKVLFYGMSHKIVVEALQGIKSVFGV